MGKRHQSRLGVRGLPQALCLGCALAPSPPAEHFWLGLAEHGGCWRHHRRAGGCGAARPGHQSPQRQALVGPQICKQPLRCLSGACVCTELGWAVLLGCWVGADTRPLLGVLCLGTGTRTFEDRLVRGEGLSPLSPLCPLPSWQGPCSPGAVPAAATTRGARTDPLPCPQLHLPHSQSTKLICCPAAPQDQRTVSRHCRRPGSTVRWWRRPTFGFGTRTWYEGRGWTAPDQQQDWWWPRGMGRAQSAGLCLGVWGQQCIGKWHRPRGSPSPSTA